MSVLFPQPAMRSGIINASCTGQVKGAYVSRGSTVVVLLISTLLICRFERTILRFLYGVLSKRRDGSLKDQEVRAKV